MKKDGQRQISLGAALVAVSFKRDANFGKRKEEKKNITASSEILLFYFFLL